MTAIKIRARGLGAGAAACTLAVTLAACTRTEVFELPEAELPSDWVGPVDESAPEWPNADWWNNFESPELTALIDEAMENNFDLATNRRNLRAAELSLEEAGLSLYPTPNVSISNSANTSRSNFGAGTVSGGSSSDFSLSASASYSGILNKPLNYRNALIQYDSTVANLANSRLNILRSVATTYFQLLFIRDRIVVAEQNLDSAEAVGRIAQARYDAGTSVPIDLLQQQIAIDNQRNSLRSLYQEDLQQRAALALLLGRGVQGFDIEGQTLADITVPTVRPGLPSELLTRRPDIVQAEFSLERAAVNVDLTRLSFFPSISLTGSAGSTSPTLLNVVTQAATTTFSLSASIAETLFNNGTRKRNLENARLSAENAIASYRSTVIGALNDVEIQLSNLQVQAESERVAARNLEQSQESFRIAQVRYEAGVATYETLLQSQNQLFGQRSSYLSNKQSRLNAIMSFYFALGGGWQYEPTVAENR